MDNSLELAEAEAIENLQSTLTEQILPRLHNLRISLEIIAAQLRLAAEGSDDPRTRIIH
jgi:hypothetical protein